MGIWKPSLPCGLCLVCLVFILGGWGGGGLSLAAVPWLPQSLCWRCLHQQLAAALLLPDMFVFLAAGLPFKAPSWGYSRAAVIKEEASGRIPQP